MNLGQKPKKKAINASALILKLAYPLRIWYKFHNRFMREYQMHLQQTSMMGS